MKEYIFINVSPLQWYLLPLCIIYAVEMQVSQRNKIRDIAVCFGFPSPVLAPNPMVYLHCKFIDTLFCPEFSLFDDQ